jgi:tetratricopeptide (TPR) repeat protein
VSAAAKRELGAVYDALGDLELDQRNAQAALEQYGKAFALYELLHKKERTNAYDQWFLGHSYYRLGRAKEILGDPSGAKKDFTEALKLREGLTKTDPKSLQFQEELMRVRARLGQHVEATKVCDELRQNAPKNPAVLLGAASGYALCISSADATLQRRYADLALQTLEQAIAVGFQDAVRLEVDSDLAPLRTYPEFSKLLDRLGRR